MIFHAISHPNQPSLRGFPVPQRLLQDFTRRPRARLRLVSLLLRLRLCRGRRQRRVAGGQFLLQRRARLGRGLGDPGGWQRLVKTQVEWPPKMGCRTGSQI